MGWDSGANKGEGSGLKIRGGGVASVGTAVRGVQVQFLGGGPGRRIKKGGGAQECEGGRLLSSVEKGTLYFGYKGGGVRGGGKKAKRKEITGLNMGLLGKTKSQNGGVCILSKGLPSEREMAWTLGTTL